MDSPYSISFPSNIMSISYSEDTFQVYARRWWVLLMLSICAIQQSNNWTTFSVIYDATHNVYGWDEAMVDLLTSYAQICFIIIAPFLPIITTKVSYRKLITISSLLMCAGSIFRSITILNPYSTLFAHIGQILNGIAGPLVISTAPAISSVWFPCNQRTTATSIAISASYAGCLVSYSTSLFIKSQDDHLLLFLKFEAVISIIISMVICVDQVFYEDTPKTPPSLSQWLQERTNEPVKSSSEQMWKNCTELLGNLNFHYYAMCVGVYQGLICGWSGILDTILGPDDIGYSQIFVGKIGIIVFATFILSAVGIGFVNDSLKKMSFKPLIVVLTFLSGVFLLVFVVIANNNAHRDVNNNPNLLYALICCVIAISCNAGTYGVSYEEGCNLLFPNREIIAGTILTVYINIVSCIFIIASSYIEAKYMNYFVCGSQMVCAVLLCFYRQKYDRFQLDRNQHYHTAKS